MIFSMLIAGGSSPFLWRAAPGLLLLALLLSGLSVLSFAMRARRIAKRRSAEASIIPMPPPRAAVAMLPTAEIVRRASKTTFLLLVGMLAGILWRDHELSRNTMTYTSVAIIEKIAERDFLIWPERMKQQRVQLCRDSLVDWRGGETLDDWTFEQKPGCKRVISYHEKPKGGVNAGL